MSARSFDPEVLAASLQAIMESPPFRTTAQCQALLRYIVEQTCNGHDELLRERVIGSEVFGRAPDYEPGEDPVVRIRVADVRKRLALYYQAQPDLRLKIEIPVGSYRAKLTESTVKRTSEPAATRVPEQGADLPLEDRAIPKEANPVKRKLSRGKLMAVCAAVGIAFACLSWYVHRMHTSADLALSVFWEPLVHENRPVLISVGTNAVYSFTNEAREAYAQENRLDPNGPEFYMSWPAGHLIDQKDITRAKNSFVALGDVEAITHVASYLTTQSKTYEERFPPDISFAELGESPSVLVGGLNNPKTLEFTKDLRFYFKSNKAIGDRKDPAKEWRVSRSGDANDTSDFAIVTRVLSHHGGSSFISVAGIGQYGTLAAGCFITSPQSFEVFTKVAPSGWESKNLQLVLQIRVVNFHAVSSQVVASEVW